jgi:hypothetical protein
MPLRNTLFTRGASDQPADPSAIARYRIILFVILGTSIGLRVIRLFRTIVVSSDSPGYIRDALSIGTDGLRSLFLDGFSGNFSIYPIFLYLVNLLVQNPILSGQLVSLFFGCLIIVPIYFLVTETMGPRAGLCAAFLAAIHPYLIKYSADVLKDSMLFFFAATSFALALRGHESRRYLLAFLAGVAAWTTSLVRVYGIVVVVSISVAIIVTGLVDRRKWHETARELVLFALPVPVLGYPLFLLYVGPGREYITETVIYLYWTVSHKFLLVGSYADTLVANNPGVDPYYLEVITSYPWLSAIRGFLDVLVTAASGVIAVLFLLGAYLGRSSLIKRGPGLFVLTCAAVLALIDVFIVMSLFFLSKRHAMILVILLLPWSALALDRIIAWCQERAHRKCRMKPAAFGLLLSVFFTASVILTLVFTSFLDPELDKRYYKRAAGEYIKALGQPNPILLIPPSDRLTAFYSGGTETFYHDPAALEGTIAREKPDYILWDTDSGPLPKPIVALMASGVIEQIQTIRGTEDNSIVIYRVRAD